MTNGDGFNLHRQRVDMVASYLKVVDLVCEVVDACCPKASSSTAVARLIVNKQHLTVLNKASLADSRMTAAWLDYFKKQGRDAVAADSKSDQGLRELWRALALRTGQLHRALEIRGRQRRGLRVAVLGIPNTGKSTLLNRIIGRQSARTGNRPGLTRGPQWVHLNETISVLDTPGIISISRVRAGDRLRLGAVGSLELHGCQAEEVCEWLLSFLAEKYSGAIARYVDVIPGQIPSLNSIASARGFLMGSGLPDVKRACDFLLDQFRSGRMGPITLEAPDDEEK